MAGLSSLGLQASVDAERLLQRFLRYVQIDTTAVENAGCYPSSPGQLELGRLLSEELRAIGLSDVELDQHGIVMATLPATTSKLVPTIAFNAHVDTSPETSGKNVRPQVIRSYHGGDIVLPGDSTKIIRESENPDLEHLHGKTIITSDGTTLLGSDDKSGVAVIMEAIAFLHEHPEIEHGPIKVCFTCDEEIGHGVDHVNLEKLGATVCYTLDGGGTDEIDVETFSADLATVTVRGVNIHPSIAKDRMVNAIRVASHLLDKLPHHLSPEDTSGRQGFLHPYVIQGGVAEVMIRVILRDFDTQMLRYQADLLQTAAAATLQEFPGADISVDVTPQYRNMADGLHNEPRAVDYAEAALKRLGRTPKRTIVRGGTDGSRFTELGLPTPNLSTGEHNPHSPLEWTCLEEMVAAVESVVAISQQWAIETQ